MTRALAGGEAARRSDGGVLSKAGARGKAARRSVGEVLGKAGGGGKAGRRSGGEVLGKVEAEGKTAWRSGGEVLVRQQNGRSWYSDGSHNFSGRVRDVRTWSVTAAVSDVFGGAGEWRNGVEGAGVKGDEPIQDDARGGRLDRGKNAGVGEADADGVGAGEAAFLRYCRM